jgi:lincosamide nucleotidyltransferase A/C/D/E
MTAADVLEFLDWTAAAGIPIWVDGGWAVDALLGEQTRDHRDLDIALPVERLGAVLDGLEARGFARRVTSYQTEWNFECGDRAGRVIDLHVLVLDATGTGGRMGDQPSAPVYPAGSLSGTGSIAGRAVACIEPSWLVRFHAGYEPDADDWQDVRALCDRFDLPAPAEYDRFRDGRSGPAVTDASG